MLIRAQVRWTDGYQFVARTGDGPALVMDTSEGKSGPTPMGLLLIGVAGCTAIDVVSIMKKKRAKMTGFEVVISGDMAEDYPKRYTKIHIEYVLHGRGISPKSVEQAIKLSHTKYCSAMASLNALFEHSYRIAEEAG
jgi:putative redox protein